MTRGNNLVETGVNMARYARRAVQCTVVTAFLLASALAGASSLPAAGAVKLPPCPRGRAAVTNVAYVIFHSDGSSNNVSTLRRNVRLGDTVNALFNVPALPSGCSQVELSLASYSASDGPAGRKQGLVSSDTGDFLPGGRYEMSTTVALPPAPGAPPVYFSFYFVSGPALIRPNYGGNIIQSARN